MRLVYFGSGAFGLPTLRALQRAHDVALVVTQPERGAGRRRRVTPTPVAAFAGGTAMRVIEPADVNEPDVVETIRAAGAAALVAIAYGQKLGPALLEGAFAVNLHASLLPKYRGAAPINWAMINGERETGVSVITVARRMDAGDVLLARSTPIDPLETAGELHDRLAEMGPEAMLETLDRYAAGTLSPRPQDESAACAAPRLSKADGTTAFDRPAAAVRARVHGLTPWPGCTVDLDGRALKLLRVRDVEDAPPCAGEPGCVLADGTVACAPGALRFLSVQPPGGRAMTFDAYRRGHRIDPGARMTPQ